MIAGGVAGHAARRLRRRRRQGRAAAARGDPLRQWTTEGEPFWWQVYARNKRFITLNLKIAGGPAAAASGCVPRFDVVMESFVPGTLERLGLGWDVLQRLEPEADSRAHLGLGADRSGQPAPRLRHAGRGGQRLRGDERRARRRADRAGVSARRHDLGALRRQRRDVRALPPRRARRRRAGGRRRALRVAVLAARAAGRGVRRARPAARAQRQPLEERRSARLLPDQRRPLHRGQRLDAEDGRAVPAAPTASATCWTIRASPPTRRASSTPASSTR